MRAGTVALLVCSLTTSALAVDDHAHLRTLHVGESVAFNPGELPAQVACDDLTVLHVGDAKTHFELTGLKPGSTLCSFSPVAKPGIRLVYRFDVLP